MRESVLAEFFLGRLSASDLSRDIHGSTKRVSDIESITVIENMSGRFLVTRDMAIALCDAVLTGELPTLQLNTIGFALVTSDSFCWNEDDHEPAESFYDWSAPEINFPLTLENVRVFRSRLMSRSG